MIMNFSFSFNIFFVLINVKKGVWNNKEKRNWKLKSNKLHWLAIKLSGEVEFLRIQIDEINEIGCVWSDFPHHQMKFLL